MLGQIASIVGMILNIASFQMKTRKQIIIVQILGTFSFMLSYFLLKGWPGFYLNAILLVRNIVFYFGKDKKWCEHILCLLITICVVIAVGMLGFQSWVDLLPIAGSVFGTISLFMKNENMLRLLKLCDSPCWLAYNCTVPSTGGIICEVFSIISVIVGLIRFRKDGFRTPR